MQSVRSTTDTICTAVLVHRIRNSCLLSVPTFDVTTCLVHDPMHILFEGVTMYETKLFLKYAICEEKFFTVAYLNRCLSDVFCRLPSDGRPNFLSLSHLTSPDNKLKQTAYQMWIFSHILPAIVGHKIPDGNVKWQNFLRLVQIQQLCTSPVASSATITTLTILIARHNQAFLQLYSQSSYIPKLHYLVHLPAQIKLFGPLRHQWCMRMESKNSFFKRKKYRNTINLPKTVSYDHQHWMCCQQRDYAGNLSNSYLEKVADCNPGSVVCIDAVEHGDLLRPLVCDDTDLLQTPCVTVSGVTYRTNDLVMNEICSSESVPSFLRLSSIFMKNRKCYGIGLVWHVQCFDKHSNLFCVAESDEVLLIRLSHVHIPWPLIHLYKPDNGLTYLSPLSLCDVMEII